VVNFTSVQVIRLDQIDANLVNQPFEHFWMTLLTGDVQRRLPLRILSENVHSETSVKELSNAHVSGVDSPVEEGHRSRVQLQELFVDDRLDGLVSL